MWILSGYSWIPFIALLSVRYISYLCIYIVLTSVYILALIVMYLLPCASSKAFTHLHSSDVSSLARKSSALWGISLAKPLLDVGENSIVAEASVFTGASHLSRAS